MEASDNSAVSPVVARPVTRRLDVPGRVTAFRYRADVDGLRAVAVVSVVMYHLDVPYFGGGYIGVDVFFVISGYLITRIVLSDIEYGRYSLLSFYDRRIRRIFPALFALIAATFLAGFALLLPPEITGLARSAIATTLFVSNMYFLNVADYFNKGADQNPLLHTWSLAVEEQFYIFFPLLLYGLRSAPRRTLLSLLWIVAIFSFLLSIYLVRTNQTAAFYLVASRTWELLTGALLAVGAIPAIRQRWLQEGTAALGLILLVLGVYRFYGNMPFPGMLALVPCIGTACLIHAGETDASRVTQLLSLKPVVFLGLISYSLYLWHWPIIVFTRFLWIADLGGTGTALIFAASVLTGALSWRYIETPFRRGGILRTPTRFRIAAIAAMVTGLIISASMLVSNGFEATFPPQVQRVAAFLHYDDRLAYRRGTCFLDAHRNTLSDFKPELCMARSSKHSSLLVIGDSHAAHLWSGLAIALPALDILQATASGCKPVFSSAGAPACQALLGQALETALKSGTVKDVLLAARWEAKDIPQLLDTVHRLASHVERVYVAGPIVEYRQSLPRLIAEGLLRQSPTPLLDGKLDGPKHVDSLLRSALAGHGATYLSTYQALCPAKESACLTQLPDGSPVQWDYGHLTSAGSLYVVRSWISKGDLKATSYTNRQ